MALTTTAGAARRYAQVTLSSAVWLMPSDAGYDAPATSCGPGTYPTVREYWRGADASPNLRALVVHCPDEGVLLPDAQNGYNPLVRRIASNGAASSAPGVGDELPDCVLTDADSGLVRLMWLLESRPLVVSSNSGAWRLCCRLELAALSRFRPTLSRMAYRNRHCSGIAGADACPEGNTRASILRPE